MIRKRFKQWRAERRLRRFLRANGWQVAWTSGHTEAWTRGDWDESYADAAAIPEKRTRLP